MLDIRQRLLMATGKQPFYIFVNGENALRAGTISIPSNISSWLTYTDGCMRLGTGGNMQATGRITLDVTKYSKLHVVASNGAAKTIIAFNSSGTLVSPYISIAENAAKQEYVFDVSDLSGSNKLIVQAGGYLLVYDIWLE